MKNLFTFILIFCLALYGCSDSTTVSNPEDYQQQEEEPEQEPEEEYEQEDYSSIEMSGFTVKIKTSLETTSDAVIALALMEKNLEEIAGMLDETIVDDLRSSVIWMELDVQPTGAAWYHPSEDWLIANDMDPEKAQCVEICNYVNYVSWSNQNQPYMVMHELTHLYHNKFLGDDHQGILAAYALAYESGVYHNCQYMHSEGVYSTVDVAYAMDNEKEYFAEITEAYLGENDYYPFNYEDLKESDPTGFALAESIWGEKIEE